MLLLSVSNKNNYRRRHWEIQRPQSLLLSDILEGACSGTLVFSLAQDSPGSLLNLAGPSSKILELLVINFQDFVFIDFPSSQWYTIPFSLPVWLLNNNCILFCKRQIFIAIHQKQGQLTFTATEVIPCLECFLLLLNRS